MDIKITIFEEKVLRFTKTVHLPCVIGRSRLCTVSVVHPMVSRRHCEIYTDHGMIMIRDLGSLNGTFYKASRIGRGLPISPGEQFSIGNLHFLVEKIKSENQEGSALDLDDDKESLSPFSSPFQLDHTEPQPEPQPESQVEPQPEPQVEPQPEPRSDVSPSDDTPSEMDQKEPLLKEEEDSDNALSQFLLDDPPEEPRPQDSPKKEKKDSPKSHRGGSFSLQEELPDTLDSDFLKNFLSED